MNSANSTPLEDRSDRTTTLKSFGDSIGKFDGELHLYTSNNVISHKTALKEIPLCVLKNNFVPEVKDLQQQGTPEKVTEPTEWVSAHSCKQQTLC